VLYEQRQREGVMTEALNSRWGDTLALWRDRPEELQAEPNAQHLRYSFEREGWLVFLQGYPDGLPDWVAVHAPTGEVRRFQDESQDKVLAALLGSWPPPAALERMRPIMEAEQQKTLARLREQVKSLSLAEVVSSLPTLAETLREATFPVYGLAGHPLDLSMCGVSRGHKELRLTHVGFMFSNPPTPGGSILVDLCSSAPSDPWPPLRRRPAAEEVLWQGALHLEGKEVRGRLYRWSFSTHAWMGFSPRFTAGEETVRVDLASEETVFAGLFRGLSAEDVLGLLHGLVVLNEHTDLQAQYQQEWDREKQRHFGP
jgi:hypothetical protein